MKVTYKTFTLIEMLIVIVIIGILASALIPRLRDIQWRARDTQRKTDLQVYNNAFAIFRSDNGYWPISHPLIFTSSTMPAPWITWLSDILTSLPVDPINNFDQPWSWTGRYSYAYYNNRDIVPNPWLYSIVAQLENHTDWDRAQVKGRRFFGSAWTLRYRTSYNMHIYDASPFRNGVMINY